MSEFHCIPVAHLHNLFEFGPGIAAKRQSTFLRYLSVCSVWELIYADISRDKSYINYVVIIMWE
jgi:hypothetical protein